LQTEYFNVLLSSHKLHVFCKILICQGVNLFQGLELHDISILQNYIHVQKVDISNNDISGKLAVFNTHI